MKVLDRITIIILFPIYYIIHHNIFFGFIHKTFVKKFYYKKFIFSVDSLKIPLANYSSFFFKTYEYNDKKLIEKNITTNNKCIIIGGGIGFIATLTYHLSKNKILVFEINKNIIKNLKKNLSLNKCKFNLITKNLTLNKKSNYSNFYLSNNFLANSLYLKTENLQKVGNINKNQIKNFDVFNTLIIDGEGVEEHFIKNLHKITNINHLFFEFHHNIFSNQVKKNFFKILKKNNFKFRSKCFNSYYFAR